jgi:hypothetical protein
MDTKITKEDWQRIIDNAESLIKNCLIEIEMNRAVMEMARKKLK